MMTILPVVVMFVCLVLIMISNQRALYWKNQEIQAMKEQIDILEDSLKEMRIEREIYLASGKIGKSVG